ncbi:threonine aldolase family protein [Dyadobacter fanqingshengii]|uniref:Aminotransferase class I/II-fold pyridoxal phosphate-dependent enzyme n=1 Tax=Dyadobacter fanqingshengii TaxID=2906443 RepID=A0A9X1P8S8_9BACT|nr:GntG family PLP-dependent aldolase [Dyadobacter fanqingshengii]MCF0039233.1 aminotransferase class I/II-fold pyridoxal phosphate-dependent enzyme [Dyadobacter fanqingshengii]USJ33948.1 aminotransferase class I/II-fold pyridoxal phosphate-dependent enzyme [Dyadobacter fanqingshengii]
MKIDLRSDTVTKPTKEMQQAMWAAEVGDDVLGDDPTVNALQEKAAKLFGMEEALFCPSGTMTNQLAIRVHTQPGSDVICDKYSHIYLYEGGGIMLNALSSVKLLDGDRGRLTAEQVAGAISPLHDIHSTVTRLVSLENTMNKGGGCYYDFNEINAIKKVCNDKNIPLHLDGARLFNALVETGESPLEYGKAFDSISICLSKGLGCPVGSLLLGTHNVITKARRFRKVMGGGWRQAGFLAAAGIYALDHHVERLKEDHARARAIGNMFEHLPEIEEIFPVDTNIVIIRLAEGLSEVDYVNKLAQQGILAVTFGKNLVRFVTHLDFTDDHLHEMSRRIRQI